MHHRNINLHIRKEPNSLFSDCTTFTTTKTAAAINTTNSKYSPSQKNYPVQLQSQLINTSHQHHHLQIKISPFSSSHHPSHKPSSTHQSHLKDESFCQNQSTNNALFLSTSHGGSIMTQSSNLSPHPIKISCSSLCSSSLQLVLATRRITLKFIHLSCHPTWIKLHLKLLMLFFVPSLYLFTSIWPFILYVLCIVIISTFLVFSCNTALPTSPIRLLLARALSSKAHNHHHPVVWSIGSKAKPEKRPNSGCWVQVYSNGDVYEGEFHKGKCSGSGVYYYHMSGRYEGDWVDEKYDGYGVETWAKGSRYRGQYRLGLRHGVGVYRSYTGDVYAGEWFNGQCHGCGVHTCADGSSYIGEFKYGVKHGLGHYHFRNGDTYAGEYFADKMHGFGVYSFGNGHRYEGAWHEGRRQGLGMYTYRNGETQSGHWQNGVLNVSVTQPASPGSPFVADHPKVLNAVQESRRAAEKAFNVAKVNERVNRAITAANRAATAARVAAVKAVQNRMHRDNNDFQIQVV